MIKLLDCTLRDGGYYTNWHFDTKMVQDLVYALDLSNVDIIELGYKSPVKGGRYRKCNDRFIWEVLDYKLPINSQLAFMVDAKDFIIGKEISFSLINDVIAEAKDSPFSICRLAIKHDEIEKSIHIGKYIKDKGYDLIINLMGISLLSDEEIKEFGDLELIGPLALYFADSYGALEPTRTEEIVQLFNKFNIPIGVHTHDNLGLAFANCLSAINSGATYIDGTLLGMGRGVGNVKTEQLVTYLQYKNNKGNCAPIQKFIEKWMHKLLKRYKWGFTHNYMVSGLTHIHPLYTQTLQSSYLNSNRIEDILLDIPDPLRYNFSNIEDKMEPKVAVVIPARFKSSRFPGKPLAKILDKEMIIWVAELAEKAVGKDNVYIATENEEIVDVVKEYGFKVVITSDGCLTGTDRVAEAALEIDADIIVNVQGDEPLVDPNDIKRVIKTKLDYPDHIVNCQAFLNSSEDVKDKKIPKVITNLKGELMYSSRNPIPGTKTGNGRRPKKQVCIYAFNREHLKVFSQQSNKTPLEAEEDIEINRFLELGYKVKMVEVEGSTIAVDYPEDIDKVTKYLIK
jgi:3-deoxy-manno-octulosonate cytidylyltransferase (CMP-KDO synthetase)